MADPIETWLAGHESIAILRQYPTGSLIGNWRITAFLARGGAGEVYRAENRETGLCGAIKVLHKTDENAERRFAREVEFLTRNDHPAFPRLYDQGFYSGRPYYVMEMLEPCELPSEDADVAEFMLSVCVGVAFLHSRGLVHRDIKPSNIMSRKGAPVLIDLGLLKNTEINYLHAENTVSIVDGRAVGVGTPGYAAPEQLVGEEISPSSDLHALGTLANTCFHGNPPPSWREIIRRSTATLPSQRYGSVLDFERAIRNRHLMRNAMLATAILVMVAFFLASHLAVKLWQNEERIRRMEAVSGLQGGRIGESSAGWGQAGQPTNRLPVRRPPLFKEDPDFTALAGKTLGLTQLVWRTSAEYPWLVEENVLFQGRPTMKNTGNGGGEAISLLATEIEGPAILSFHYRKNFYGSRFQIVADGVTLFVDAEASHRDETWYSRKIEIPEGRKKVFFVYHHAGIGWANEFNGVYLADLSLEKVSSALDPLDDLPREEHYYLVPNVHFSKDRKPPPARAASGE